MGSEGGGVKVNDCLSLKVEIVGPNVRSSRIALCGWRVGGGRGGGYRLSSLNKVERIDPDARSPPMALGWGRRGEGGGGRLMGFYTLWECSLRKVKDQTREEHPRFVYFDTAVCRELLIPHPSPQ